MYRITREELANGWTHAFGIVLAPVMIVLTVIFSSRGTFSAMLPALTFPLAVMLMYSASTIYHFTIPGRMKRFWRYVDHINIYMLIAASYTPILLYAVGGVLGWIVFGVLWGIALGGTFYKIFFLGRWPKLSLAIYLTMGWSGVFVAYPVWKAVPSSTLWFLLAEGIFYTTGSFFFANDNKHRYFHAIWHIFVLLGTLAHFGAVWTIW